MRQTDENYDDTGAVATALSGVIVRGEQNLLADTAAPGFKGARAALETFYEREFGLGNVVETSFLANGDVAGWRQNAMNSSVMQVEYTHLRPS